jgi:hypothetical protein
MYSGSDGYFIAKRVTPSALAREVREVLDGKPQETSAPT